MEPWFQMVATIVCAVVASSGFWAYIQKRSEKKDVRTQMLIGLAHDRIVYLGMSYIDRGWITQDEYENLHDYLYKPYEKMGGNGSAKKVMSEVNKLMKKISYDCIYKCHDSGHKTKSRKRRNENIFTCKSVLYKCFKIFFKP